MVALQAPAFIVGDTRDRYGRSLRYVYLAGEDCNARLIRDGYAHAIRRFSYTEKQRYITLEDRARGARTQLVEPPLIRVMERTRGDFLLK